ncbi:hypothetical protein C7S16_3748 [Burkholderia thailandensis]|uniref:Uncharacterized protein n=1 Tax=Burkholderia thailandensis TaxID=57975 RepID=A0AAW9D393_BURTH|nr:hypothetical protein [Burkholderia thailandensis]MDW9256308.1 hypothetical protein [Burkholderia thailandensis]
MPGIGKTNVWKLFAKRMKFMLGARSERRQLIYRHPLFSRFIFFIREIE